MVAVVRTGDEYQAQIPALLPPDQCRQLAQDATPRYAQRWGQPPASTAASVVDQFLASSAHVSELEQALQCLFASGFDAAMAVERLHAVRRQQIRERQHEAQILSDDAFGDALAAHGKKFHFVKQALPGVQSTREVVRKFYLWKSSASYARWRERDKARKRKESTRVLRRHWGEDSDSDAPSDYHNEYCDLCFTGGQLLCCDGCCRAFHFSCVTPPIKEVPKDDWFCAQCRALLGSDVPPLRPSDENKFCSVVLIEGRSLTSTASDSRDPSASRYSLAARDDATGSEEEDTGSGSDEESPGLDSSAQRLSVSLTDNDEFDNGELPSEDATSHATKKLHRENMTDGSATKRWLSPSVESSPSPSLASASLLSVSSSRKRQRKIDAPRRLLLSQPPSQALHLATPRVKTTPGPSPSAQ